MVHLRLMVQKLVIKNECYLKDKKEKKSIIRTIEGTNYDNSIWLSDTKKIIYALSRINNVKRKMNMEAMYNYLPTISPKKSESLPLYRDMPSEESVSPAFIFRDPSILLLVEVISISSSEESEGYVPRTPPYKKWSHEQMSAKNVDYIVDEHHIDITSHNYVLDDKSKGCFPFWDRYK